LTEQKLETELTQDEKTAFLSSLQEMNKEDFQKIAEFISMLVRAFEGKAIEPEDIISRFTNVKNLLERSRFMTYPLVGKQVYLRLIAEKNKNAKACLEWADREAEALISYKGLSREEYVDSVKAATQQAEQEFYIGEKGKREEQEQPKRHWWQRKRKEESEFNE
jgi:hypothetical protein